jgi:hypothetical protein
VVFECHSRFKAGRVLVENDECSGRHTPAKQQKKEPTITKSKKDAAGPEFNKEHVHGFFM